MQDKTHHIEERPQEYFDALRIHSDLLKVP